MPGAFNTLTGQLLANIPGTTFVSGYSVAMALAMVACGSSEGGALESELLALFGKGSLSALQAYVVKAQASLHAGRGEGLELLQANSLWARGGLKDGFSKAFTEVFHGGFVAPLTTRDPINQFVSTATKGLVNELIPFDPTPDTLAILVNTAYFRGMWAAQFSKDMTQKSRFCGARGEAGVQMMSRKFVVRDGVGYAPGVPIGKARADVLSMPYQGGRFHGVFALPSSAADIDLLVAAMADGDAWPSLHKPTQPTEVRVFVPRFKLDPGLLSLADLLKTNGGVPSLSTPENLLRVSDSLDLAVSDVLHRAVVEVNEEGTEAAAATAVILRKGCARRLPAPIPEFRCDRPFLFAVYDTQMRFPLFAGAVHDLPPA